MTRGTGSKVTPRLEQLEDRRLMAGSIFFSATTGVISIVGTPAADTAVVSKVGDGLTERIVVTLSTPGQPLLQRAFTESRVERIVFAGLGGNDTFVNLTNEKSIAYGGAGADRLVGGSNRDILDGGAGNDVVDGRGGNDLVLGGIGNDVVLGGTGDDELHGGDGADYLVAGAGRDRCFGEAGNDKLFGDRDDRLFGGAGDDHGFGHELNDTLDDNLPDHSGLDD